MDEDKLSPREEESYDEELLSGDKKADSSRLPWVVAVLLLLLALGAIYYLWWPDSRQETASKPAASQSQGQSQATLPGAPEPSAHGQVVDVQPQPGSPEAAEQAQRKKPYGLDQSVDAVVRSDESIKLGDKQVPVRELERKLVVEQRGDLLDKPLGSEAKVTAWAVRVVERGDNLWDIHYDVLQEYLKGRGVELGPKADEPTQKGYSSGVGKVLKFAEHMVGIYNLRTGAMTRDINLLEPGRKVVVFNLSEIFAELAQVDPNQLSGISYDGRVLLFPERMAAQPKP